LGNVAARLEHLYGRRAVMQLVSLQSGGVEVRIDLPRDHASRTT
jgi:hypothetical protein